jgi:hypothetical protein
MVEKFCDIIPHSTGWIYIIDGIQSAPYPTYDLAVRAANAHADRELKRTVFRQQKLNGEMSRIGVSAGLVSIDGAPGNRPA